MSNKTNTPQRNTFTGTLIEILAERGLVNNDDLERLFNNRWDKKFPNIRFIKDE